MAGLIEMLFDALPFAMGFCLAATIVSYILAYCFRRKPALWKVLITTLYVGFLLHGTIIGRIDSLSELWQWEKPSTFDISYQISLNDAASALHALFNVALFIPWGICGMLFCKRIFGGLAVILSGCLMSVFIECFQVFHRMSFDAGDFVANAVGCIVGVLLSLPFFVLSQRRRRMHARRA